MQQRDVRNRTWELFGPIILKVVVSLLVEAIVVAVFTMKYLPDASASMSMEQLMAYVEADVYKYIVEITAISALATIPFLILMRSNDRKKEKAMGLVPNNRAPLSKYVYVAVISIVFSLALNNIVLLSDLAEYSIAYQEAAEALYSPSLIVQILCLGIVTPIMEEYICRGRIFKRLRNRLPVARAIISSALFFGI